MNFVLARSRIHNARGRRGGNGASSSAYLHQWDQNDDIPTSTGLEGHPGEFSYKLERDLPRRQVSESHDLIAVVVRHAINDRDSQRDVMVVVCGVVHHLA